MVVFDLSVIVPLKATCGMFPSCFVQKSASPRRKLLSLLHPFERLGGKNHFQFFPHPEPGLFGRMGDPMNLHKYHLVI